MWNDNLPILLPTAKEKVGSLKINEYCKIIDFIITDHCFLKVTLAFMSNKGNNTLTEH